jgi:putative nucleotidyltransferase with HDIG domain
MGLCIRIPAGPGRELGVGAKMKWEAAETVLAETKPSGAKRDAARRKTARILLVDGEARAAAMICAPLEDQGHTVQVALSGHEALQALSEGGFDLVLADIVAGDFNLDGSALLEKIHEKARSLPVVMVTDTHDVAVAVDYMRRGACDCLLKPFDRDHLLSTVERALDNGHFLDESQAYRETLDQMVLARTEMLRHALEDIESSYEITLEALGDALDLKDSETEGHSRRVTAYTVVLAMEMNLPPEEIKVIKRGAYLHDIGKLAIPDEILRKSGMLSAEEKELMREHCERGYDVLRKIPFLAGAAEIVYCHQEYFDGGGYPNMLRGQEIPIGARIFSVADALDAITSDRPYRRARSFDEAREEIHRCSGKQFDPEVVKVFLKISTQTWQLLRNEYTTENRWASPYRKAEAARKANS